MTERDQKGIAFQKGEALGNDYLVVDAADLPWPFTPARAVALCDRHRGAGSDGVLLVDLRGNDINLRILNPDGSEAEKSGNGLRILAAYLHGRGVVGEDWFTVQLIKESVRLRVERRLPGGGVMVNVEMGRARFRGDDVGFRPRSGEVLGWPLPLKGNDSADVTTVSLGNPHCVVFVQELEREDFLRRAPQLCTHGAFSAGTNVQFARVIGPNRLEAWIYERGAGETLASGSSACAVAAAAVRRGFVQAGMFEVRMLGGSVEVEIGAEFDVRLRGPARMVYDGRMREGIL
jgi:diaminopimelate epimerase